MEHNAIKGFHLKLDETGKEIVHTSKLYTWYMQRTFRESLDEPVKPGDVVLVKGRRNKNGKKYTKSRVLVMETFHFDGDTRHSPVLKVLEKYVPKNS
jgi:hypothetical protein